MKIQIKSFLVEDIPLARCTDEAFLSGCIQYLIQQLQHKPLRSPTIVRRQEEPAGMTLFSSHNYSHIVLTSFTFNRSVFLTVHLYHSEVVDLIRYVIKYFSVHRRSITEYPMIIGGTVECQEPNCKDQATHNWGGLSVCQDHYERYKKRHDDDVRSLETCY